MFYSSPHKKYMVVETPGCQVHVYTRADDYDA